MFKTTVTYINHDNNDLLETYIFDGEFNARVLFEKFGLEGYTIVRVDRESK